MDDFGKLLLDTLKKSPEIQEFIARFEHVEAAVTHQSYQKPTDQVVAITHKDLVKQVGGALVRRGEAEGILIPIVSTGGKGPKKRYLKDQVDKLLNMHTNLNLTF